jgi:hypothetical protein
MKEEQTSQAPLPNAFMYTAVITACAFAIGDDTEKKEAVEIGMGMFDEPCESDCGAPNHVTFVA